MQYILGARWFGQETVAHGSFGKNTCRHNTVIKRDRKEYNNLFFFWLWLLGFSVKCKMFLFFCVGKL